MDQNKSDERRERLCLWIMKVKGYAFFLFLSFIIIIIFFGPHTPGSRQGRGGEEVEWGNKASRISTSASGVQY